MRFFIGKPFSGCFSFTLFVCIFHDVPSERLGCYFHVDVETLYIGAKCSV